MILLLTLPFIFNIRVRIISLSNDSSFISAISWNQSSSMPAGDKYHTHGVKLSPIRNALLQFPDALKGRKQANVNMQP